MNKKKALSLTTLSCSLIVFILAFKDSLAAVVERILK